jgi:murein DD-endopeptidase MepM/ murein hydrolase activator NlpD
MQKYLRNKKYLLAVSLLFAATVLIGMRLRDTTGPEIIMDPDTGIVSPARDLRLTLRDQSRVRSVEVKVLKGQHSLIVFEKTFIPTERETTVSFSLRRANLGDGDFTMEVRARDASFGFFGKGNTTTLVKRLKLDSEPPRITISTPPSGTFTARRGSAMAISYSSSKELRVTGVQAGDFFFPAYKQENGRYYCIFAFPVHMDPASFNPEIIARDLAGNEGKTRIMLSKHDRQLKTDILTISDSFLNSVMPSFASLYPDAADNLERYIAVNRELRVANEQTLFEIGQDSGSQMLLSNHFQRLPGSSTRALFGDQRTYKYADTVIDNQTHMGVDLASTVNSPIPAGNDGMVVYARDLGIFGNTVIIDHGLGLMSLYAHLSEIQIKDKDTVKRGQIIGKTGKTGLAGGDHLHFGILVHGLQVQPLEWFDRNWIKNNITDRMKN